jgi:putative hydrolase
MPSAVQLAETVRRRRAAGGPAEQTFATLVGLQLRPRRLRDAANLWAAVRDARGIEGRDELWSHPDLLPSAADLDDPIGFAQHAGELADIDITDFLPDEGPSNQPPSENDDDDPTK